MANFGSFLQGIGLAAGNNMIVGQQMDAAQADMQYKQNQVAMQKMDMLQRQTEMANQKTEGEFFASQLALDKSDADIASKTAKAASIASAHFAQTGDLVGMKKYAEMARGYTEEAQKAQALRLSEQHEKQVAVSEAAADYNAAPPEQKEGLKNNVIKAALAAGTPMSELTPILNDPAKFATFANNQQLKTKEGMARQKLVTDEVDRKDKQAEAARHNKSEEELRLLQIRSLAASREQAQATRAAAAQAARDAKAARTPQTIPTEEGQAIHDPEHKIKGARWARDEEYAMVPKPMLEAEKAVVQQVVSGSSEGARNLRVIMNMPVGATSSAFEGLHSGTILESLGKVGANVLTPQSSQMYDTVLKGLGLDIGRVVTAGGGRGVNQAQVNEFKEMTRRAPGDTEFVAMFKVANAADVLRNRLRTNPDHPDPKVRAIQRETEEMLEKMPLPEQVLAEAMKHKAGSKVLERFKTMTAAANAIKAGTDTTTPEHTAPSGSKWKDM